MSRRKNKPHGRMTWDPRCPYRCEEGWRRVKVRSMGREREAVERCSCVRMYAPESKPRPAKKKGATGHDAKQAAAGEQ